MIKRLSIAMAVLALVAGCSSGVDLDNVPVEDKNGAPLSTGANGANAGNTGQSGVRGVDLSQSGADAAGPVGVSRIVYFDYDSYVIKQEARALVEAHARFLVQNPQMRMLIQGNTDERGSREYNLALGQKRADVVKQALMLLGAKEAQIESVSLGEEKPRCEDRTEACYGENRRGDMLYSGEF